MREKEGLFLLDRQAGNIQEKRQREKKKKMKPEKIRVPLCIEMRVRKEYSLTGKWVILGSTQRTPWEEEREGGQEGETKITRGEVRGGGADVRTLKISGVS